MLLWRAGIGLGLKEEDHHVLLAYPYFVFLLSFAKRFWSLLEWKIPIFEGMLSGNWYIFNHDIRNEVSGAEPVGNGFEYKAAATACPMTGIDV